MLPDSSDVRFHKDWYIPQANMDQFLLDAGDTMRIDVTRQMYNKLRNDIRKRSDD